MTDMVTYDGLLERLRGFSEEEFAAFNRRVVNDEKLEVIGVRMPQLRKVAKEYYGYFGEVSLFPDEYFEVVFVKLCLASRLKYEDFIKVSDGCVALLSDWALCDCFAPACVAKNRESYIPFIKKYLSEHGGYRGGEFVRRFALTTLLHFYVEEDYLPLIFSCIENCDPAPYYVAMGAAWLLAEVLVKHYVAGFEFLSSTMCDINIKLKAISKACDSYRISPAQKAELRALRAGLKEKLRAAKF